MKNYISDIEEFKNPASLRGHTIILSAGTGCGKTTAILGCAEDPEFLHPDEKLLFLTTRIADKEKLIARTGSMDRVTVRTLQGLATECEAKAVNIARYVDGFACVAVDEAHHWASDSAFAHSAVLTYEACRAYADGIAAGKDHTMFLISATPEKLSELFPDASEIAVPPTTDHIGQSVFIPPEDYILTAAQNILAARDRGEKGIVFFSEKADMEKVKALLKEEGAAGCVATYAAGRKELTPDVDGNFSVPDGKTAILTTSVLAFGLDFWQGDLTFVMTDTTDPVLAVQELGRKRCRDGETVTYYLADHTPKALLRAYAPRITDLQDARLYLTDRATYEAAHADGGRWAVRSIDDNLCLYTPRGGAREVNRPFWTFCERLKGYADDLASGEATWRTMILSRLGYRSPSAAPVIEYADVIRMDVQREIEKLLQPDAAPTKADWMRLGLALRVTDRMVDGHKYGRPQSQPASISKHLQPYGYRASGKRKQRRQGGKVISFYPLERM